MPRRFAQGATPARFLARSGLLACLAASIAACDDQSRGLERLEGAPSGGYVLFSPLLSTSTYLVDRSGRVVHTWTSELPPGAAVKLLANGNLMRCGREPNSPFLLGGGQGGRLQEFAWDGGLLWDFTFASDERVQHHDFEPLPNGNVLLLVWERRSRDDALRAGRRPERVGPSGLWPEAVFEVHPMRPRGGEVVWEWHLWDHLVQEFDPRRENFGRVSELPRRVDINGGRKLGSVTDELLERLRGLGYLAGAPARVHDDPDFIHANSIAYDLASDRIVLSASGFGEIWVIDHGTTTREAAGRTGGRAGRGGDLLYRWGNPASYGRGRARDQQLFGQHDARWIPTGFPGAGHLLIFNNGLGRPGASYSSVVEIELPQAGEDGYPISARSSFAPRAPVWQYTAPRPESFYADFLSGAQRLEDGGTFITEGPTGRCFEVTAGGETVWEYSSPFSGTAPNPIGDPPYSIFRAEFVAAGHPALAGRDLRPLDPQPRRPR